MTLEYQEQAALQPYAERILALSNQIRVMSFHDSAGKLLWSHSRDSELPRFEGEPISRLSMDRAIAEGCQLVQLEDHRYIAVQPLASAIARRCAFLCLELADADSATSSALIQGVSELLTEHFDMLNELNAMTDELARRYEELNLLYETDEQISHVSETRTALGGVVQNCAEYLDVDMSMLLTGSADSNVERPHEYVRQGDATQVLDAVQEPLLAFITRKSETIVMNTAAELSRIGLEKPLQHKIVASPVRDDNGRILGVLAVLNGPDRPDFENGDRSLLRVMGRRVSKILSAEYDSMTGLMNRESFTKVVGRLLPQVRKKQSATCLLHVNIDRMQLVNDALGHDVGDRLICEVADMIRSHLRGYDHIARIGGDEFGILLDNCDEQDACRLANRLGTSVTRIDCSARGQKLDVGISTGVVGLDDSFETVIGLMAAADLACSAAKDDGRGRTKVFQRDDKEMQDRATHMRWVSNIQEALKKDRFVLFSQLIAPVDPSSHAPHYEVLLRMLDADDKVLSPGVFMPVAERYHMMPEIDRWVIDHALTAIEQFSDSDCVESAVFAINLSGLSITDRKTLDFVLGRLRETAVNTSNICFEITETAAISNLASAHKFIASVKNFGCKFALDDFGAGVSSFSNLRSLDLDYVKIDGSFVSDMTTDPISEAMVISINQVGQTMRLSTVAEFVETPETEARLRAIGVNFLQGYGVAKPRPFFEQLEELKKHAARSA